MARSTNDGTTSDNFNNLTKAANTFGSSVTNAFASGIAKGKDFDTILQSVTQKFLDLSLKAGLKPLDSLFSSGLSSLTSSASSSLSSLFSGSGSSLASLFGSSAGAPLNITPFAEGGVVSSPSYFPLGNALGVAGERGSEAIMPLTRGADGRLGVAAQGGRGSNVVVNIAANGRRELPTIGGAGIFRPGARCCPRQSQPLRGNRCMNSFHEIRFPLDIALGIHGGPERKTDIVLTGSGREERNARWAQSRRRYDAGFAVKTIDALSDIVVFFEERRGRLTGFRLRDRLDRKSCSSKSTPAPTDQPVATGDGVTGAFQLRKRYGAAFAPYDRDIRKPVAGTVRVAVNAVRKDRRARISTSIRRRAS